MRRALDKLHAFEIAERLANWRLIVPNSRASWLSTILDPGAYVPSKILPVTSFLNSSRNIVRPISLTGCVLSSSFGGSNLPELAISCLCPSLVGVLRRPPKAECRRFYRLSIEA